MSGAARSNECPAGSERIEAEAACRTAAAAAGKTFRFVVTYATVPRGCSYDTSLDFDLYIYMNYAYLNTHAVGAGNANNRLLCAAVTTGGTHGGLHGTALVGSARVGQVLSDVLVWIGRKIDR